jgi:tellurium resistance protein TerD
MSIQLKKGHSFNLSKKEPSLKKIMIGLGWELRTNSLMDLDASVFMLGGNGKLPADEFFVFYNNLKSPDGSIQHTGDNRNGAGDEDDEMILANLNMIDSKVNEILIVVTIHDANARKQNFGYLQDAYIRLVDVESKREILSFDLDASFASSTDVEFGKLQRIDNEWHFVASGIGGSKGLEGYVNAYA